MRRIIRVLVLPVVFAVSAGMGYARGKLLPAGPGAAATGIETSDERLLVLISSSKCGFSNADEMPDLVRAIRERVRTSAGDERRFVTVGIAKDVDVTAGLNHLAKFAPFDEVMAGRSWANIGVLKYVWKDLPGTAATPEIVIVDRRLIHDGTGPRVENEKVILRVTGLQELRDFASGKTAIGSAAPNEASPPARSPADAEVPQGR